ncbi:Hypothetical predicted protein [Xyrichtys novacula]|uniref:Uncharacterized protein n=1 Tax=Xyrichtys novacula TaxID=13765 RepID=A0AAV1ELN8_XYRNO|nr:Hypothetical predicted protein [Xyrichtys novacula]
MAIAENISTTATKRVPRTGDCDTLSASLSRRNRRTIALSMIYFLKVMVCYKEKQADLSVVTQSRVSLAIVSKPLFNRAEKKPFVHWVKKA